MDLLADRWLPTGTREVISPLQIGDRRWRDLRAPRADYLGALFQFLVGVLQTTYPPRDIGEWCERWSRPPSVSELETAFAPWREAFLLHRDGPAFMQDLQLPADANRQPVLDLLIDAGSDSNRFFNRPDAGLGMCLACFAQAILTLQINAPAGGRGVRTSLRGGGPLTTLLLPADESATLWHKLWLNVLPLDALGYPPVEQVGDVLPWMVPTRTSDGSDAQETQPQLDPVRGPHHVHPLQAYWGMPRRIRLDPETMDNGDCAICGAANVGLVRHYRTRHGGTNYTGNWRHPLTPYTLDPSGQKPPISAKGHQAGRGYRDWLGLVLGNEDGRPAAAQVVAHFIAKIRRPPVRLWCFGYSMSNAKALCWYDSTLPVHAVEPGVQGAFRASVKQLLDHADECAGLLATRVKAARPGGTAGVARGFWQQSEPLFYSALEQLARIDPENVGELAPVYREWLFHVRRLLLSQFDGWTTGAPLDALDLERVVRARAALEADLNKGRRAKALWAVVNVYSKESA